MSPSRHPGVEGQEIRVCEKTRWGCLGIFLLGLPTFYTVSFLLNEKGRSFLTENHPVFYDIFFNYHLRKHHITKHIKDS